MKKIYYPISRRPARHLASTLDAQPPRVRAQRDLFVYNRSKVEKISGLKAQCFNNLFFTRLYLFERVRKKRKKLSPLWSKLILFYTIVEYEYFRIVINCRL